MSLPGPTRGGAPISADALNRLSSGARERTVSAVGGGLGLVQHRGGGINLARRPQGLRPMFRRQPLASCPFNITIGDDGAGGLVATFRAGTINGLLPSNYLTGVTVPASGTKYLVLTCTANNGEITAASFSADAAAPGAIVPYAGQPPVSFKILIGLSINGTPIKIWGCGNIQASGTESFRLQKVTPVAGQVPYDIYYTWTLGVL
jgi:hypothetical protein